MEIGEERQRLFHHLYRLYWSACRVGTVTALISPHETPRRRDFDQPDWAVEFGVPVIHDGTATAYVFLLDD